MLFVTLNVPIDGFLHNHYSGLLSVFSPDDVRTLCVLLTDNKMVDPRTFTLFVTTAAGTQYLLKIQDTTQFTNFASSFMGESYENFSWAYEYLWKIKKDQSNSDNEKHFLHYLTKMNGGSELKLFRGNDTFTEWTPLGLDRDSNVIEVPCE